MAEGELTEEATCKQDLHVRTEGKRRVSRSITLYRLEMILAVDAKATKREAGR